MFQTVHILKYIFPRQFKLHNVFTSKVDSKETIQPFKDYTLREQEIALSEANFKRSAPGLRDSELKVPRRLRGQPVRLVQELQRRNRRCAYYELLKHYCGTSLDGREALEGSQRPSQSQWKRTTKGRHSVGTQKSSEEIGIQALTKLGKLSTPKLRGDQSMTEPNASLIDLATSHAQVSAFCRACLSNIVPNQFWGDGEHGLSNKALVMSNVDRFIKLRRFENLSLHAAFQGIQVGILFKYDLPVANHGADSLYIMACLPCCITFAIIYVRRSEAQRAIPRISVLRLRLFAHPIDQIKLSCHGVQRTAESSPLLSPRCLAHSH